MCGQATASIQAPVYRVACEQPDELSSTSPPTGGVGARKLPQTGQLDQEPPGGPELVDSLSLPEGWMISCTAAHAGVQHAGSCAYSNFAV